VNEDLKTKAMGILEETDSPLEILQARKAVEIGVVRLAIDLATDDDILTIRETWDSKYEQGLKGDYNQYIEHGKDFHFAIARATKNRIIEQIMAELLDATNQPLWIKMRRAFHDEDPERTKKLLEMHNDLVKAIMERDSAKATLLLEEHFDMLLNEIYDLK
jgi:GntR family transcriptional repressor for pyruvate dehydrogenase complex